MPMKNDESLEMLIIEYMLHQKMLGRTKITESEIMEALGCPWDRGQEDRSFELTDLGEQYFSQQKKGKFDDNTGQD